MTDPIRKQARVDSLYVWERLEEIVAGLNAFRNPGHFKEQEAWESHCRSGEKLEAFMDELAHNIKVDTGHTPAESIAIEDNQDAK